MLRWHTKVQSDSQLQLNHTKCSICSRTQTTVILKACEHEMCYHCFFPKCVTKRNYTKKSEVRSNLNENSSENDNKIQTVSLGPKTKKVAT